jgi:prolyl-tRNA synthetase
VTVLDPSGERVTPIMGCYGIGVERALAAVVESHHDDRGIVWPVSVAPFQVAIAQLGSTPPVAEAAASLYEALRGKGVEVILDDRDERPGVKFSDLELVGIPYRVTVSARGLTAGTLELTTRATGAASAVPIAEAADRVVELMRG